MATKEEDVEKVVSRLAYRWQIVCCHFLMFSRKEAIRNVDVPGGDLGRSTLVSPIPLAHLPEEIVRGWL